MKTVFLIILLAATISCVNNKSDKISEMIFRYNESKGITSLDPAYAKDQKLIWPVNQLFNGLVQMDDSLNVLPCISYRWESSADLKVYTFYLRQDVFFHDNAVFEGGKGRQVVAQDFEYSFSRIIDPSVLSPGQWIFDRLDKAPGHPDGFKAINDSVFRVWLKYPFPPFLGMLTMPYCCVVPKEAVMHSGFDFARNPVGTGPFKFKFWREDEKLVLVKNSNYFEFDKSGIRLPYLDAVAITFIKDKQSEFLEFLKGNLDFLNGVHPVYKDILLTSTGELNPDLKNRFKILKQPYLNTEYLGFLVDTSLEVIKNNPLKDINLRKAINYGFDRVKMIKYLRNNIGTPALSGFIPQGLPAFNEIEVKGYFYNPDTAKYFLEKAGFKNGNGLSPLVLTTIADYIDICEYIQFELSKIGIEIIIDVATGGSLRNKVANSNLAFFRGSWIADYPDAENYLSLFYSSNKSPAGPNYTQYSDPVYDSLYLEALITTEPENIIILYNKMDKMIIDASPIVPLFYDCAIRFIPLKITGLGSNPMNLLSLKNVKYRN